MKSVVEKLLFCMTCATSAKNEKINNFSSMTAILHFKQQFLRMNIQVTKYTTVVEDGQNSKIFRNGKRQSLARKCRKLKFTHKWQNWKMAKNDKNGQI